MFRNNGRNTEIEYFFYDKMKIHAKDNDDVMYTLDFELDDDANTVACMIVDIDAARYKVRSRLRLHNDYLFKYDDIWLMIENNALQFLKNSY